jgi:hypothetical protein
MSLKILILVLLVLLAAFKADEVKREGVTSNPANVAQALTTRPAVAPEPAAEPTPKETPYPGRELDQVFPFIAEHTFGEDALVGKPYSVAVDDLQVNFQNFAPKSISRNRQTLLRFNPDRGTEYISNWVGKSHLLGERSKEIYVSAGNGGICCGEDWVADVTNGRPRIIFHRDEWGYFYGSLEIFDADGDGVYEIEDTDASFRYIAGLLGASSPQPRAVFKYDRRLRRYVPAPGLQQDFVKQSMAAGERWIIDASRGLDTKPASTPEQFKVILISQVVDLLFQGKARQAWSRLNRYCARDELKSVRAELRGQVRKSPYLRAIRKLRR